MSTAPTASRTDVEHLDVVVIGAGISGIGAAYYLQRDHPDRRYVILEARAASGGTWDLFRYPGIRSDSDLHTFGFEFKPWQDEKSIADAPAILSYLREAEAENGRWHVLPADESHLVHRAFTRGFAQMGLAPPGVRLACVNAVPHGRGLGSSSAAIVAGLALARGLVADGRSRMGDDTLEMTTFVSV